MAICGNTKLTVPSSFDAVTLGDQVGLSVPSRTRDWCVTQLALGSGLCPPPELHHLGLSTKLSKTFLRIYSQNSLCKFKAFKVEESGRHFVRTIFLSVYKISKYFDRTGQLQHLWGGGVKIRTHCRSGDLPARDSISNYIDLSDSLHHSGPTEL